MNYYPFHLGDYTAHTAHLEPIEDLAYRRMLDAYYLREGPLPPDTQEVARLIRLRGHHDDVQRVLAEFFVLADDGWTHSRCDEEIGRMQDKQAKARASAAASVNARKTNAQRTFSERSTDAQQDRQTDVELPTPTPTPTPNTEGKPSVGAKRAAKKCPADFELTPDLAEWANQHAPLVLVLEETSKFRDHTFATARTDWVGTWRNWMRKAQDYAKQRGQTQRGGQAESFRERDERIAREKWEQITGRKQPAPVGDVIDVTPAQLQIGGEA